MIIVMPKVGTYPEVMIGEEALNHFTKTE